VGCGRLIPAARLDVHAAHCGATDLTEMDVYERLLPEPHTLVRDGRLLHDTLLSIVSSLREEMTREITRVQRRADAKHKMALADLRQELRVEFLGEVRDLKETARGLRRQLAAGGAIAANARAAVAPWTPPGTAVDADSPGTVAFDGSPASLADPATPNPAWSQIAFSEVVSAEHEHRLARVTQSFRFPDMAAHFSSFFCDR
jgi:hypothetical protein